MFRARPLALLLALASAQGIGAQTPPPTPTPPAPSSSARPPLPEGPAETPPAPAGEDARPLEPERPRAVLEEVSGIAVEVDRKPHRVVLETASGRITLTLDRNTMVYTDAGLGTVLDVKPGARLRVARNSDFLAYWVQVRPPETRATSPAGQAEPEAPVSSAPPSR